MMITQAVLLLSFSGILNTSGMDYFPSRHAYEDVEKNMKRLVAKGYFHPRVEYNMPVIEPPPGNQYYMPSVTPDPSKDYKTYVVDPDDRMGRSGKEIPGEPNEEFKEGTIR